MDFFGGLGNIFHSIGNFITGHGFQSGNNAPTTVTTTTVAPQRAQSQSAAPSPVDPLKLFPGIDANTLQKATAANAPKPAPAPAVQPTPAIPNFIDAANLQKAPTPQLRTPIVAPSTNIPLEEAKNFAEGVGRGALTIPLAATRAVSGIAEGTADLPEMASNLYDGAGNLLTGQAPGTHSGLNKAITAATDVVNTPFDVLNKATDQAAEFYGGDDNQDAYKGAQVGANVLTALPAAGAVLSKVGELKNAPELVKSGEQLINSGKVPGVTGLLSKFRPTTVEAAADATAPAPDEVATGVKSTNPNQVQDAQAVAAQRASEAAAAAPPPVVSTAMHPDELAQLDALNQTAKTRVLTPEEKAVQTALQTKQAAIQAINEPKAPASPSDTAGAQSSKTGQPPEPAQPTPEPTPQPGTPTPSNLPPEAEAPGTSPKIVENPSSPENVPQTLNKVNTPATTTPAELAAAEAQRAGTPGVEPPPEPELPAKDTPTSPNANTAPNAPEVQAAFKKATGTAPSGQEHEIFNQADAAQAAERKANAADINDLVNTNAKAAAKVVTPQDAYDATAAANRIVRDAKDHPNAAQALKNLGDEISKAPSDAGQMLGAYNDILERLPAPIKANVVLKKMNSLRALDPEKFPKIEDPKVADPILKQLTDFLQEGDDLKKEEAAAETRLEEIKNNIGTDKAAPGDLAEATKIQDQLEQIDLKNKVLNRDTAQFYDSHVPGVTGPQKLADWARTSMLTAPSGRLNNAVNVAGNAAYEVTRSVPQAIMGRVINAVGGAGKALDSTLLKPAALLRGAKQGARLAKASRGGQLIDEMKTAATAKRPDDLFGVSNTTFKSKLLNKVSNLTHTAVGTPRDIIGGAIKQAQLERLARQEGQEAGHTGDALKVYTKVRSTMPSRAMADKAQEMQDQISHTNKNFFAEAGTKVANALEQTAKANGIGGKAKGVASLIKNTFLPFAKYPATWAWNTLTDRNVAADAVKLYQAAKQGDVNAITKALAGGAVDTGGMYLGYHLSHLGVITNNNAEGYNDNGAYLHIGGRYIPLGLFGVGAASWIAGNAMYNATKAGGDPLTKFGSVVGDTILNTIRSGGAQTLLGADNQGLQALQDAVEGKPGSSFGDAAATIGSQSLGQFIPGSFSDVNSILNNGLGALPAFHNPTHEAAETKVTKGDNGQLTKAGAPSTARDVAPSLVRGLVNRIPFASQYLPRKAGVAAPDFIDRTTRGDRETSTEVQAAAAKLSATQQSAADKAGDIPDPTAANFSTAVEARVENGDYDKAMTGLQQKLAVDQANKDIPPSTNDKLKGQISQLQVAKDNKLSFDDMKLYNGTTLSEWRNLGDPKSDTYDPTTYNKLWAIDQALAARGAAGAFGVDGTTSKASATQKFSAKAPSKSGSGSGSKGTGDNPIALAKLDYSNLSPQKISATIPTIQTIPASQLIKQRTISVSPAK